MSAFKNAIKERDVLRNALEVTTEDRKVLYNTQQPTLVFRRQYQENRKELFRETTKESSAGVQTPPKYINLAAEIHKPRLLQH